MFSFVVLMIVFQFKIIACIRMNMIIIGPFGPHNEYQPGVDVEPCVEVKWRGGHVPNSIPARCCHFCLHSSNDS